MKTPLLLLLLATAVCLRAQTSPEPNTQGAALELRRGMADAVGSGLEQPEAALIRLQAHANPSGLALAAEADFALAAIDVGRRLIAANKPAGAEPFFAAAEAALDSLVERTPDTAARDKAQYLQKLSAIRASYLNKAAQAKKDIEQALSLQPDDKDLKVARDRLLNSHAELAGKDGQAN